MFEGGDLPADPRPPFSTWRDHFVAFDLYGVRPSLEMNGKRKYKSCWGAFVSALCLLFIAFFIFYKLSDSIDAGFLRMLDAKSGFFYE